MKNAVVITGPGRSGTSLCARILAAAGLRFSPDMNPPSEQNPAGIYEDAAIVRIHQELMSKLFIAGVAPHPGPWSLVPGAEAPLRELRKLLAAQMETGGLWGFKDPRTTNLIPAWIRIFNREKVVPIYIFCTRHPLAIRESLERQYGMERERAEFLWLFRTVWFLKHIGSRAFILHYEDWHERPTETLAQLVRYIGLEQSQGTDLQDIVLPSLDRSSTTGRLILEDSEKIAEALEKSRGADFDSSRLNRVVDEIFNDLQKYRVYFKIMFESVAEAESVREDRILQLERRIRQLRKRVDLLEAQTQKHGEKKEEE